ncbi:ABC transporter substrate-binding protein [Paenibacillus thalictri]|uniref:Myristoyl transferase n=1 Tax=Paenibacillus thalictri TaxID=2527873 RepID=A0A4Q9DH57_9BACL|nr:ABC transporter substrate-binding protein [Paenibacillus thalictri]TBL70751.1 myristoyl transferase [Paenibacillus thalictri]
MLNTFNLKKSVSFKTASCVLAAVIAGAALLSGCSSSTPSASAPAPAPAGAGGASPAPAEKPLVKVTQVTNWFAQPEHGGNYTALAKGFYKEAGLDMTIQPGGPGVSATQIVGSGKAQFGMGSSDEVLLARERGIPIVAVMTVFQKSPQAMLVHKGQNIKSIADLNGHKVIVGSGVSFWEYFKKAYKLDKATELKYTGDLSMFLSDPASAVQSYITSEPYVLQKKGVETESLLNADFGFAPYANLMYTTETFLKEHPDQVKAFVEATIKGWNYYKDHWQEINPIIKKENPDNPEDVMEYSAKTLQPLVFGSDAEKNGVGYMTKERWEEMNKQLVDLGLLKAPQDVSKAFTTEFIPKK